MRASGIILLIALALVACGDGDSILETEMEGAADTPASKALAKLTEGVDENLEVVTAASGLQYVDLEVGEGASPAVGQAVRVHYEGWLLDGNKFDEGRKSLADANHPLVTLAETMDVGADKAAELASK